MAWIRLKSNFCVYCGAAADSDEHFPPQSNSKRGFILSACRECNSIAGTVWPRNFFKRAEHVTAHLTKKYSDEIDRLDEEMARCQKSRNQLAERLAWNAASNIQFIDLGNVFAPNIAEECITQNSAQSLSKPLERESMCPECAVIFTPSRPKQRFCSTACRMTFNNEKRRAILEWAVKQKGVPKIKCKPF